MIAAASVVMGVASIGVMIAVSSSSFDPNQRARSHSKRERNSLIGTFDAPPAIDNSSWTVAEALAEAAATEAAKAAAAELAEERRRIRCASREPRRERFAATLPPTDADDECDVRPVMSGGSVLRCRFNVLTPVTPVACAPFAPCDARCNAIHS